MAASLRYSQARFLHMQSTHNMHDDNIRPTSGFSNSTDNFIAKSHIISKIIYYLKEIKRVLVYLTARQLKKILQVFV